MAMRLPCPHWPLARHEPMHVPAGGAACQGHTHKLACWTLGPCSLPFTAVGPCVHRMACGVPRPRTQALAFMHCLQAVVCTYHIRTVTLSETGLSKARRTQGLVCAVLAHRVVADVPMLPAGRGVWRGGGVRADAQAGMYSLLAACMALGSPVSARVH
jgi:hypothetical protein